MNFKTDVYLNNPKIRQLLYDEDLLEYLKEDLDIHENDHCVLMTYKYVINKPMGTEPDDWDSMTLKPDDIQTIVYDSMLEFNLLLGINNPKEAFKMIATAEITDKEFNNNEISQAMVHILVNIRQLDITELKNILPDRKSDWFKRVEFDSIFVENTQFPKPYRDRWYIEPVSNMAYAVKSLMDKYEYEHLNKSYSVYDNEPNRPERPKFLEQTPIWRINEISGKNVDIQYYIEQDIKQLNVKLRNNPDFYELGKCMESKYIINRIYIPDDYYIFDGMVYMDNIDDIFN